MKLNVKMSIAQLEKENGKLRRDVDSLCAKITVINKKNNKVTIKM